jgi:hypothetical protein
VIVFAALEAPTVVSRFDDVAVMSEAIEQRGRHLAPKVPPAMKMAVDAGCHSLGHNQQ